MAGSRLWLHKRASTAEHDLKDQHEQLARTLWTADHDVRRRRRAGAMVRDALADVRRRALDPAHVGEELRLFPRGRDFMILLDRNELTSGRMSRAE